MNILFLSAKKTWAGIITWNVSLARTFSKGGHRCYIISATHSALTRNAPDDICLIPMKYGFNYNPLTLFRIARFIRSKRIDIIVTNIKREVIFGGVAGKIFGIPVVRLIGNEHDFDSGRFAETEFVSADVFPCGHSRALAHKRFEWLDENKTCVIHTGKPIADYDTEVIRERRAQWGASDGDIVIGISDRLVRDKGIQVLINAFDVLCRDFTRIRLVITGGGEYEPELKDLVGKLGIEDRVHFAGFATDVMLTASAYDIAVLASFYEAFPNTVVEYMASNTAVVCADVGGVSELVKDGFNGFLIRHNDVEALTGRLKQLIEDRELRKKFAANALDTVRKGFSEEVMAEKTMELFKRLTGTV